MSSGGRDKQWSALLFVRPMSKYTVYVMSDSVLWRRHRPPTCLCLVAGAGCRVPGWSSGLWWFADHPPIHSNKTKASAKVPDDAWEYQIRKALNDAAYNGLDCVPYSSLMPVPQKDDNAKWMWKKASYLKRLLPESSVSLHIHCSAAMPQA